MYFFKKKLNLNTHKKQIIVKDFFIPLGKYNFQKLNIAFRLVKISLQTFIMIEKSLVNHLSI